MIVSSCSHVSIRVRIPLLLVNYNYDCITININGHDYCVEKRWGSSLYCILYVTLFINKADYTFRKLLLRTNSNSIDD